MLLFKGLRPFLFINLRRNYAEFCISLKIPLAVSRDDCPCMKSFGVVNVHLLIFINSPFGCIFRVTTGWGKKCQSSDLHSVYVPILRKVPN